jgi:hypothetical protein
MLYCCDMDVLNTSVQQTQIMIRTFCVSYCHIKKNQTIKIEFEQLQIELIDNFSLLKFFGVYIYISRNQTESICIPEIITTEFKYFV